MTDEHEDAWATALSRYLEAGDMALATPGGDADGNWPEMDRFQDALGELLQIPAPGLDEFIFKLSLANNPAARSDAGRTALVNDFRRMVRAEIEAARLER